MPGRTLRIGKLYDVKGKIFSAIFLLTLLNFCVFIFSPAHRNIDVKTITLCAAFCTREGLARKRMGKSFRVKKTPLFCSKIRQKSSRPFCVIRKWPLVSKRVA